MIEAEQKKSFWSRVIKFSIRFFSFCILMLYLASIVAFYLPPSSVGPLSVLALFYWPLLLLFLFSVLLLLLRREWKWLALHALIFLASIGNVSSLFSFGIGKEEGLKKYISVYTQNVHLMGYYDGKLSEKNKEIILSSIESKNPDVICLQECYWNEQENSFFHWGQDVRLKDYFPCERVTHTLSDGSHFGVVILSKFPIRFKGTVPFENDVNNFAVYADVDTPLGLVRFYSVHFQSFRLKDSELKLFDENLAVDEIQNNSLPLLVQLYRANLKREKQVDRLMQSMNDCQYPVVLCGDFNDSPSSNTYYKLTRHLNDSYSEANIGVGATYNGPLPGMRIDYILHDERLAVSTCEKLEVNSSDHDALLAIVGLK
jgi:endonuclease/exonuclease/phosphatase family metal-dependent hydrolase